jgi:hypothetical protein
VLGDKALPNPAGGVARFLPVTILTSDPRDLAALTADHPLVKVATV